MLGFTWECIDYTDTEMVLQLYFEYPLIVSTTEESHTLKLVFNGQEVFKDVTEKYVWPRLELRKELPRQMDPILGE